MPIPFSSFARFCIRLAAVAVLCVRAHSQEPPVADKDDKSPILLRVICKQPVTGSTDLKIIQGEKPIQDLEITDSLMTEPFAIGRGELLLVRQGNEAEKPVYDPVLKVTIPNEGKRFVLALFSAVQPTPAKPYEYRLIRTDGLRFGASDLYMFNLTTVSIGGLLGKEKFVLEPDSSDVVTPQPEQADSRMYQSRFYSKSDDQVRIFNDTRWPLAASARIYLFFIPDPERQSIGYLSFREYGPFE
jgi:hypothetical protein